MTTPAVFPPSDHFVRNAQVQGMEAYLDLYRRAEQDPEKFWAGIASHEIHWFEKWSKVLDWQPPFAKWFVDAKLNVSYNCIDRHCLTHRKNKVAILWEGEPGDQRFITYQELHRLVSRFASVLQSRGYKAGDRSVIYMPMVPELPIAMLASSEASPAKLSKPVFRTSAQPSSSPPTEASAEAKK
jgi:acetyl-CoA synthetase